MSLLVKVEVELNAERECTASAVQYGGLNVSEF